MHTDSPTFGTAFNPWNRERTCGGSSGGDGALVGARCVPLSIGTDVGGSLRVPSMFNGAYAMKPSSFRASNKGNFTGLDYNMALNPYVKSAAGPIANYIDDLKIVINL